MDGDQCQYQGGGGLSVREEWQGECHIVIGSLLHVLQSQQFGALWDICMQLTLWNMHVRSHLHWEDNYRSNTFHIFPYASL